MKRIFTTFFILMVLCIGIISAQSNASFGIRNNQSSNLLYNVAIVEGENNTIYGLSTDYITADNFIYKLNNEGQLVWHKKLQLDLSIYGTCNQIMFFNNEVYVLATTQDSAMHPQYVVLKTDLNGNLLWSKILHPTGYSAYQYPSISASLQSGIVVSSSMYESIDLFALNPDGTANWIRNFTTDSFAFGKNPNFDISVTSNGDIMGCCKTESDMSFYCMGNNGNMKWARRVLELDLSYTHVKSIVEINPNKFLICGYRSTDSVYGGFYGFIDSLGAFIDFRIVNQIAEIKNGILLDNGNILLDGQGQSGSNTYLIIDNLGNVVSSYINPSFASSYSYNEITATSNFIYLANGSVLQRINNFNSLTCLNMFTQPITFTGDDPSLAPSSNYFALNSAGTISSSSGPQLLSSNLQLEVACIEIGIDETNMGNIHIFPTILNNNESIFVEHSMQNTSIDYQILELNGKVVALNTLKDNSISINGLNAGMYVIQFAIKGNVVHRDKFVVVN